MNPRPTDTGRDTDGDANGELSRDSGTDPSRRTALSLAATAGLTLALGALPAFTASAAPRRPADTPPLTGTSYDELWWRAPGDEGSLIEQGLPVGNGRLGALASNDPGRELLLITDATMWTGGLNDTLDANGQFPYGRGDFGSFTLLARLTVDIPGHDLSGVNDYRRALDLAQGLVTSSYVHSGVTYRRQIFASHPDDAIVLHFTQSGGGRYTGSVTLEGTHGEKPVSAESFGASLPNGLRYGAAVTAYGSGGRVRVDGTRVDFSGCKDLTVVVSGGTNYAPDADRGYRDPT
ncbi:glycoside hydrolase N-terminal domain-containing protein, partial [Streptomyces albiflaviniger]|nr:glycoside hydrolase N-terminal domain-containing protein [Streptomyces albiflaviniger]